MKGISSTFVALKDPCNSTMCGSLEIGRSAGMSREVQGRRQYEIEPLSSHKCHDNTCVLTDVLLRLHVHHPAVRVWRNLAVVRNGARPSADVSRIRGCRKGLFSPDEEVRSGLVLCVTQHSKPVDQHPASIEGWRQDFPFSSGEFLGSCNAFFILYDPTY